MNDYARWIAAVALSAASGVSWPAGADAETDAAAVDIQEVQAVAEEAIEAASAPLDDCMDCTAEERAELRVARARELVAALTGLVQDLKQLAAYTELVDALAGDGIDPELLAALKAMQLQETLPATPATPSAAENTETTKPPTGLPTVMYAERGNADRGVSASAILRVVDRAGIRGEAVVYEGETFRHGLHQYRLLAVAADEGTGVPLVRIERLPSGPRETLSW